jgi:hypothetical protein
MLNRWSMDYFDQGIHIVEKHLPEPHYVHRLRVESCSTGGGMLGSEQKRSCIVGANRVPSGCDRRLDKFIFRGALKYFFRVLELIYNIKKLLRNRCNEDYAGNKARCVLRLTSFFTPVPKLLPGLDIGTYSDEEGLLFHQSGFFLAGGQYSTIEPSSTAYRYVSI